MTYKELTRYVIGASVLPSDGTNVPGYVEDFYLDILNTVKEEQIKYEDSLGINLSSSQYTLPYNYVLGKLSSLKSDADVEEDVVSRMKDLIIRKIKYDILSLSKDALMAQAIEEGDRDISV